MDTGGRVLVTGGTGFIGSAIVRRLVREGVRVRVLDDGSRGRARRVADVKDDVEFVEADIRDGDSVRKAARGVDSVVHLAFVNGTRLFYEAPELVLDVGVRGMLNVLDACRAEGVGDLVLASSSEVYQTPATVPTGEDVGLSIPDPHNPRYSYAGGKLISELMAINWGRTGFDRVVVFRPHNVYGPDMGSEHVIPEFILRVRALMDRHPDRDHVIEFPIQGTGDETRAFVYIDDFVDGFMRVWRAGSHLAIYHIGTSDEISVRALVERLGRCVGRRLTPVAGPEAIGGTIRRCPDISKMRSLGFEPRVTIDEGLARTVEWYFHHGNAERSGGDPRTLVL